jgi:calcineurin-like phosphoesterase family protein
MLANWAQRIKKDDVVLHLGDLMVWYPNEVTLRWAERMKKLPGEKYIIFGNHDEDIKAFAITRFYQKTGFRPIKPFLQNQTYFSHERTTEGQGLLNIHGHSHNHAPYGVYDILGYTYYNASIEGQAYRPKRLGDILQEVHHA